MPKVAKKPRAEATLTKAQAPRTLGLALLVSGVAAAFALYVALDTFYLDMVVEYGYSAYEPGGFERAFLFWYTGLAVLATLGLTIGLALLLPGGRPSGRSHEDTGSRRLPPRAYAPIAVAFALVLAVKFLVLHNAPTMDDENVYHFTAQLLLHGKLWLAPGVPEGFLANRWGIVIEHGKMYGMYPHGWPLLLALGHLLRVPWLISPLLSLVVMLLAAEFARRAFSTRTARTALLLFAVSPFFVLTSATDLSEPAGAAAVLASLVSLERYFEEHRLRWLWLCGAAGGFAFLVRQLTALGLLTPFVLYLLWSLWKQRASLPWLVRAAALLAPLLAAGAIYLALNWATTGHPFEPGYNAFARLRGVGKSVVGFGMDYTPIGGSGVHTVARGILNSVINLIRLNTWLLGWPLSLLAVVCARPNLWTRLALAAVSLQLALYVAFFNPGLDLTGPTYYYEAGCLLLVLAADGLLRLGRWYRQLPVAQTAPRAWGALVTAILFVNLVMFAPTYLRSLYHMTEGTSLLYRSARDAGMDRAPAGAVVFVRNVQARWRPEDLYKSYVYHPRTNASLDDPVIFLNDRGAEKDREALKKYFPGRRGFQYGVGGDWKPQWTPLE